MQVTRALRQQRQPLIRFLGKRQLPKEIDNTPHPHPSDPSSTLPKSFATYRQEATQHGPLKSSAPRPAQETSASKAPSGQTSAQIMQPYGLIGGKSAKELGPVQPKKGEFWDRSELPSRFHRQPWTPAEIEAIESGGASMFA